MSRSSKKGPYVDPRVLKKIEGLSVGDKKVIKTWSRACVISPEMIGFNFGVHNGKEFINVFINENMVGHKLGEFAPSKKFRSHGGKMAKEQAKLAGK
uniref:Small ribosomal subunit protein uS19 n=1 Tax=candidate division CPR3 bacterium TaxID=2268181 RepID=A0A7C4M253_UNCC3